jgi:hypothetical protein
VSQLKPNDENDPNKQTIHNAQNGLIGILVMLIILLILVLMKMGNVNLLSKIWVSKAQQAAAALKEAAPASA